MSSDLYFEGKKYISSKRAAAEFGYTQDYVGQLIREKKVEARMIGRNWFVSEESVASYQRTFSNFPKERTLFQPAKSESKAAISAPREINVAEEIRKQTEAVELPKPAPAAPALKYMPDEGALMPELTKEVAKPVVAKPVVVSEPIKSPFTASKAREIGSKVVSGMLSLSLVLGGYWMTDAKNAAAAYAFLNSTGERMNKAIADTFGELAAASRTALDAYVATLNDSGARIANGVSAIESAGRSVARSSSDSLAAVASGNGSSVLDGAAQGVYAALHPFFESAGSYIAALFGGSRKSNAGNLASVTSSESSSDNGGALAAQNGAAGADTTGGTPTVAQGGAVSGTAQPSSAGQAAVPVTIAVSSIGVTPAEVESRLATAVAPLQNQISYLQRRSAVSIENTRNVYSNINLSHFDNSNITASTFQGGKIKDTSITASDLTVTGPSTFTTGSFTDLQANSATIGTLGLTNVSGSAATLGSVFATSSTFGSLTSYGAPIAPYFTATSSFASAFPYASTTALTIAGTGYASQFGIGTTAPAATIDILQQTNGQPIISAYRATDLAPSGDFITFMTRAGTPLFRVDNSGNLQAGGIINTGSQTITSTSSPQFRVQYNSANEITTSVSASGGATIGVNGTAPALFFAPGSNQVASFGFLNASGTTVLGVDTQNGRVGVGTTTPSQTLSVQGGALVSGDISLANLTATGTASAQYYTATNAAATSTFAGALNAAGTGGLSVLQNGQTVIGTTSPLAAGIPLSVAGNLYTFGTGDTRVVSFADANAVPKAITGFNGYFSNGLGGFVLASSRDGGATANVTTAGAYDTYLTTRLAGNNLLFATNLTERMRIDGTNGNIGMGSTSPWAELSINPNNISGPAFAIGSSTATAFQVTSAGTIAAGIANPNALNGFDLRQTNIATGMYLNPTLSTGTNDYGLLNEVNVNNSPNNLVSYDRQGTVFAGKSVNNAYGVRVLDLGGPGTVGNNYGVYIANMAAGTSTNYALYSQGGTNYFGGNVGIGTTTPGANLAVNGGASGNIVQVATSTNQNVLVVDSGGRVGLGTANPLAGLSLTRGDNVAAANTAQISFGLNGTTDYSQYIETQHNSGAQGNAINFYTNDGTQKGVFPTNAILGLSVTNGRIGVGVVPTQGKLHLSGGDGNNIFANPTIALGFSTSGQYAQYIHTRHNSAAAGNAIDFYTSDGTSNGTYPTNAILGLSIVNGLVGAASTTPWATLSVNPNNAPGAEFAVGSSTKTDLAVTNGGNVGVGTAAPTAPLTVGKNNAAVLDSNELFQIANTSSATTYQTIRASGNTVYLGANGGTGFVGTFTSNNFAIRTNGTDKLTVSPTGNVGIGTSSPNIRGFGGPALTVGSASASDPAIEIARGVSGSDGTVGNLAFINPSAGAESRAAAILGLRSGADNSGALAFWTQNAGSWGERMRLAPSGNLGVGTTNPLVTVAAGDTDSGLNGLGDGHIALYANSNDILDVTSSGVQVGLTSGSGGVGHSSGKLTVANTPDTTYAADPVLMVLQDTTDSGTAAGAGIAIQGRYSGTSQTEFGYIGASKENSTAGDYSGKLVLGARTNGSSFADMAKMTIVGSTGNVGIGTTSPTQRLTIDGGGVMSYRADGNYMYQLQSPNRTYGMAVSGSTGAFLLDDISGGATRLAISTAGNVGIGTTTPQAALSVQSANAESLSVRSGASNAYSFIGLGRTGLDLSIGVAASAGQFFTNTAAGDTTIKNESGNKVHIGTSNGTTATLTVTGSSVGIGTNSPGSPLEIFRASGSPSWIHTTSGSFYNEFGVVGAANDFVTGTVQGDAVFKFTGGKFVTTNGSTIFQTITSAGNVGIGTTSPSQTLSVQGNALVSGALTAGSIAATSSLSTPTLTILGGYNSNPYSGIVIGDRTNPANTAQIYDNGNVLKLYNGVDALAVTNGGYVGIGTTSPQDLLSLGGVQNPRVDLWTNTNGGPRVALTAYGSLGYATLQTRNATDLRLGTNAGEDLVITAGHTIGIGTTSPADVLDVSQSAASFGGIRIENNGLGGGKYSLYTTNNSNPNGGNKFGIYDQTSGLYRMMIDGSGNMGVGTASPSTKVEIEDSSSNLAVLRVRENSSNTATDGGGVIQLFGTRSNGAVGQYGQIKGGRTNNAANNAGYMSFGVSAADGASNAEAMRIVEGGNVGIGTTNPLNPLEIQTPSVSGRQNLTNIDITAQNMLRVTNPQFSTIASAGMVFRVFPDSDTRQGAGIVASGGTNNGATDMALFTSTSNDGGLTSVHQSNIFIQGSTGYVGVGTTSPATRLEAYSSGVTAGQATDMLTLSAVAPSTANGNGTGLLFKTGFNDSSNAKDQNAARIYTFLTNGTPNGEYNDLRFQTTKAGVLTDALTINGSGNIGIGTTSPWATLSVSGANSSANTVIQSWAYGPGTGNDNGLYHLDLAQGIASGGVVAWTFNNTNNGTSYPNNLVLSQGNVGVGVANPLVKFQVNNGTNINLGSRAGQADATAAQINAFNDAGTLNIPMEFKASAYNFTIGNVGIGTTSPQNMLDIYSTGNASMRLDRQSAGNAAQFILSQGDVNRWGLIDRDSAALNGGQTRRFDIYDFVAGTPRMSIDNLGNVGIGTTTPQDKLQVSGNISATGGGTLATYGTGQTNASTYSGLFITSNGTTNRITSGWAGSGTAEPIQFDFNGAAAMNILSNGNVGIGTTNPLGPLDIGATAPNGWVYFQNNANGSGPSTGTSRGLMYAWNPSGGNGESQILYGTGTGSGPQLDIGRWSGTAKTIDVSLKNGNLGIGTTSPYAALSVAGATGIVANQISATSTTATSTFAGGLDVGNGALRYDLSSGVTSVDNLQVGNTTFDSDAGMVTWTDMPVTSASAAGVVNSYTAGLNGNPMITVYGKSDGAGGVTNLGVGIGKSSPSHMLDVYGTPVADGALNVVTTVSSNAAYSTIPTSGLGFSANYSSSGSNAVLSGIAGGKENSSDGDFAGMLAFYTRPNSGNHTERMRITSAGNVGIGTSTPTSLLTVGGATGGTMADTPQALIIGTMASNYVAPQLALANAGNVANQLMMGWDSTNSVGSLQAYTQYVGANNLALQPIGGNVGVGTANPLDALTVTKDRTNSGSDHLAQIVVNGATNGDMRLLMGYDTTDDNAYIQSFHNHVAATALALQPQGGNVGIGTTTPTSNLDVVGSANNGIIAQLKGTVSSQFGALGLRNDLNTEGYLGTAGSAYSNVNYPTISPGSTFLLSATNNNLSLIGDGTGSVLFQTGTTEKMRIANNGNVGIGSTSPASLFSVGGSNISSGGFYVDSNGVVGIGDSNPSATAQRLHISGSATQSTGSVSGAVIDTSLTSLKVASTAWVLGLDVRGTYNTSVTSGNNLSMMTALRVGSGVTIANLSTGNINTAAGADFEVPTLTAGSGTITKGATVYVAGAPTGATNNYAIFSASGTNYFGGNIGVGSTSPASTLTVVGAGCFSGGTGSTAACGNTGGNIYYRTANTGTYDVAENYAASDASIAAGDIVALDTTASSSTAIAKATEGSAILGVVSTDPGMVLGGADAAVMNSSSTRPVALSGRVPVKVNAEGGAIVAGDPITISSVPGVGKKAYGTDEVIGVALESWTGGLLDQGTIKVFVTRRQQINQNQFSIDASGNVGIGTTTPMYKMQVQGDVAATAFVNISTRTAKKDISYLTDDQKVSMFQELKSIGVATYRYNTETEDMPLRMGLIAEEAPKEVLADTGKGVDIYKLTAFTLAGVQVLAGKLDDLSKQVAQNTADIASIKLQIAADIASSTGATATSTVAAVTGWLSSLSVSIDQAAAHFGAVIADSLSAHTVVANSITAGAADNAAAAGLTTFDHATGQAVCMYVENGVVRASSGACGSAIPTSAATTTSTISGSLISSTPSTSGTPLATQPASIAGGTTTEPMTAPTDTASSTSVSYSTASSSPTTTTTTTTVATSTTATSTSTADVTTASIATSTPSSTDTATASSSPSTTSTSTPSSTSTPDTATSTATSTTP